jgi:hypothetical protein
MKTTSRNSDLDRRKFCGALLTAGALAHLGCTTPAAAEEEEVHKFAQKADVTREQMFQFAYRRTLIPMLQRLEEKIGSERFHEMLREAAAANATRNIKEWQAAGGPDSMAGLVAQFKSSGIGSVLTFEVKEETDTVFEIKVTECLWAKVFRDAGAAELGHSAICSGDFAMAKAVNPGLRMVRDKTLMQGHDCCNHRYVMKT